MGSFGTFLEQAQRTTELRGINGEVPQRVGIAPHHASNAQGRVRTRCDGAPFCRGLSCATPLPGLKKVEGDVGGLKVLGIGMGM